MALETRCRRPAETAPPAGLPAEIHPRAASDSRLRRCTRIVSSASCQLPAFRRATLLLAAARKVMSPCPLGAARSFASRLTCLAAICRGGLGGLSHCTLALSVAVPVSVNVHVFVLFPPLEQAPDQMASRPFETLNVICVPVANVADPLPSTMTLMPAGLEVTRSSLRPLVVTVSVAVCPGGGAGVTVSVAVLVAPPYVPEIVTDVDDATGCVVTVNVLLVLPAATVTLAGTVATVVLLLDIVTTAPPLGAAALSVTVPVVELPPTALVGLTLNEERVAGGGGVPAGFTVRSAERVTPPPVTEIVTTVGAETKAVMIWIAPLVLPAGI